MRSANCWAESSPSGSTTARLPWTHLGSIGLSQGLLVGKNPRDAQRGANKQAKNTCPRRKWEKKPGDKEISINGKARFSSISSGRGKRKQLESAFTPERGEQIHRCWQT